MFNILTVVVVYIIGYVCQNSQKDTLKVKNLSSKLYLNKKTLLQNKQKIKSYDKIFHFYTIRHLSSFTSPL